MAEAFELVDESAFVAFGVLGVAFEPAQLRERLIEGLSRNANGDGLLFAVGVPSEMTADVAGVLTWRVSVDVTLAGRQFGSPAKPEQLALPQAGHRGGKIQGVIDTGEVVFERVVGRCPIEVDRGGS